MPFDDPRVALVLLTIVAAAVVLVTVLHAAAQPPEDEDEDEDERAGPESPSLPIFTLLSDDRMEVTATVDEATAGGRICYLHGYGWVSASEPSMFRYLVPGDRVRVILDDRDIVSKVVLVHPASHRSDPPSPDQRPA